MKQKVKLNLRAGKAVPNPYISFYLGQLGINVPLFCKEYNDKTKIFVGLNIPVTVYFINSVLKIKLNLPSLSFLVLFFSNNNKINIKKVLLIIKLKIKEFYYLSEKNYIKIFKGLLKSMKIKVIL